MYMLDYGIARIVNEIDVEELYNRAFGQNENIMFSAAVLLIKSLTIDFSKYTPRTKNPNKISQKYLKSLIKSTKNWFFKTFGIQIKNELINEIFPRNSFFYNLYHESPKPPVISPTRRGSPTRSPTRSPRAFYMPKTPGKNRRL